jgi:hypothetical protein
LIAEAVDPLSFFAFSTALSTARLATCLVLSGIESGDLAISVTCPMLTEWLRDGVNGAVKESGKRFRTGSYAGVNFADRIFIWKLVRFSGIGNFVSLADSPPDLRNEN